MAWQSWSFTDGWIVAALTLVVVFILAGGVVQAPHPWRLNAALAAAEEAKETGGAEHAPPELVAHAQDPVLHGALRVVLLLIGEIIFLMVLKPA